MTFAPAKILSSCLLPGLLWGCAAAEPEPEPLPPEPAAIVAVGPTARAGPADSALDTLVVLVEDKNGQPVPHVEVTWSTTGSPFLLHPLAASTDSAGLARAIWRLPPTMDTMFASASLSVGTVTFRGWVPLASLALSPRALSLWVGDTAHATVIARDRAGQKLSHHLRFSAADPAVVQADSAGIVTALSVGLTTLSVSGSPITIPVQVAAPGTGSTVTGQVETVDRTPDPLSLTVQFEDAAGVATGVVAPDGSYRIAVKHYVDPADTVEIGVIPVGPTTALYHPSLVVLAASDLSAGVQVLLVPRSWQISRGLYQGQTVSINVNGAFSPAGGLSFWPGIVDPSGGFHISLWIWPDTAFPIGVALMPRSGEAAFLSSDSLNLWTRLERQEAIIGGDLFYPATPDPGWTVPPRLPDMVSASRATTRAYASPEGAVRRVWSQVLPRRNPRPMFVVTEGEFLHGHVELNFTAGVQVEPVHHEFLHILGLGHGCYFPSAVATCPANYPSPRTAETTADDVAHYEVLRATLAREQELGIQGSLVYALMGERVFVLGRSPLPAEDEIR